MNLLTAALHRAFRTPASAISSHIAINHFASMAQQQEESRHPERSAQREVEGPPYSAGQPHSRLRSAFTRLPLWLTLALGTAILAILTFFWLAIPDSHVWQLAFSLLTAFVLAIAALALYGTAIRRVRSAPAPTSLPLALASMAAWLLVIWLLVHLIARIEPGIYDRAGYWDSRLSAHLRATVTYLRLIAWQRDLELILTWVALPALLLPFVIETVSRGFRKDAWRNAARLLRRWQHWLAVLILGHLGLWLTGRLTHWRPLHSVSGELLSVALRLGLTYVLDIALFLFVLGLDSELLARTSPEDDIVRDTAA